MQNVRRCKQCGEVKQLSSEFFRKYYGENARGFYRVCKVCESINNRYKYLTGKGDAATQADLEEIARIEELYNTLRELGLEPPRYGARTSSTVYSVVEELLKRKQQAVDRKKQFGVPTELLDWLTRPLTEEPEYYEDVYFKLREKYTPVIGVNSEGVQQYDETYKEILDQILERFDEYEDNYKYD
jgi:carboxypeptidase C (cathepsin A)